MKLLKILAMASALIAFPMSVLGSEIKVALDSPTDLERSGSYVWAHNFTEALKERGLNAREIPRDAMGGEAPTFNGPARSIFVGRKFSRTHRSVYFRRTFALSF